MITNMATYPRSHSTGDYTVSIEVLCKERKTVNVTEFQEELDNNESEWRNKFCKSSLIGNKKICYKATSHLVPPNFTKGFYLIQAPRVADDWSLEEDIEVRKVQYKNFCEIHPLLDNPDDHPNAWKEESSPMRSSQEMMNALQDFFTRQAWKATVTTIIFNGHGNRSGMLFEKGEAMDLDEFLTCTVAMLRECQDSHGCPLRLDVVFAQCYGHLFENPSESDVTVISFTSEKRLTSLQTVRIKPVVRSHHIDLENMVEKDKKKEALELSSDTRNNAN